MAIAQLPEHFRLAIQLRDIEQRSHEELATIMGTELNTVRSRLARGRARLSAAFQQESNQQPPESGVASSESDIAGRPWSADPNLK